MVFLDHVRAGIMGLWAARLGRWRGCLLWLTTLGWLLLWHRLLLAPLRHLSYRVFEAGGGPLPLLGMLVGYWFIFGALAGLIWQRQETFREWRSICALAALALVAGVLDEFLLYTLPPPPGPRALPDILARVGVALLSGCTRALAIGFSMAIGLVLARSAVGRRVLAIAALIDVAVLAAAAAFGWSIMSR